MGLYDVCKLKSSSGTVRYRGQDITTSTYVDLIDQQRILWASDTSVVAAIQAGTLIVNDGTGDLSAADGEALLTKNYSGDSRYIWGQIVEEPSASSDDKPIIYNNGTQSWDIRQVDHGELTGIDNNNHHNKLHDHNGDGSGAISHGDLSDLGADDHTIYHNDTRGDARYYQKTEHIDTSTGVPDAGKPIKTDAGGKVDGSIIDEADDSFTVTNTSVPANDIIFDPMGRDSAPGTSISKTGNSGYLHFMPNSEFPQLTAGSPTATTGDNAFYIDGDNEGPILLNVLPGAGEGAEVIATDGAPFRPNIDATSDNGRSDKRWNNVHAVAYHGNGSNITDITHGQLDSVTSDQHHAEDHQARHNSGGADALKLDDLATPDDNTDLDASTTEHGLLRKLDNDADHYLDGQGNWTTPATVYGSEHDYAESLSESTITGTTNWTQKLKLTTGTVAAGTYHIEWTYEFNIDDEGRDFKGRVQVDDTTTIHEINAEIKDKESWWPCSGSKNVVLTNATHEIDIDFATEDSGKTAKIRRASIEIWRVS